MASVSRILWMSSEGYPQSIASGDTVTAPGDWSFTGPKTDFSGNVSIAGNLDVAGDIISRDQVNVVIQDSFLDLGFGNTTDTAQSGGFTVQMNRAASFVAGNVTSFDSASTFTYADASGSTLLAGGEIISITGLPTSLSANEGFFVVANVNQASFPQIVTITTTATASVPFAQTAFTAAAFPAASATGSAFQSDISVLAVADGSSAFKNADGAAFNKGTFVQAYISDATVSAFQANGAYNVIGGTTLQQAYDSSSDPATIATAAGKELRFTLNSTGPFEVQGASAASGSINFGGLGLNLLNSFSVGTDGSAAINSQNGSINLGNVTSTAPINIGTAGGRVITIGQGVNTGPTLIINGVANSTTLEGAGSLAIGTGYNSTETIVLGSAAGGSLGVQRTIYIGDNSIVNSSTNLYGGSTGGVNIFGLTNVNGSTNNVTLTTSSGNISLDPTTTGVIAIGANTLSSGSILIGNATSARTISISNGVAGAINIGNNASSTGTVDIVGSVATGARAVNIATGGTGAKTLTMGEGTVAASVTDIVGGSTNGVRINNNINSPATINGGTSTGTITLGGSAAQTIAIGTGAAAKTVNLGSTNTTSTTTLQAGATGKMYVDSVNGVVFGSAASTYSPVGTRAVNNSGSALTAGSLVFAQTTGTQASGLPDVILASAATGNAQGFTGVVMDSSIANTTTGNIACVPGTITAVTFVTPPSAGDSQKPVFVSTTAGQATMTPPSTSGQCVFIIGYLTSTTAVSGRYNVQLMPQFVADIA